MTKKERGRERLAKPFSYTPGGAILLRHDHFCPFSPAPRPQGDTCLLQGDTQGDASSPQGDTFRLQVTHYTPKVTLPAQGDTCFSLDSVNRVNLCRLGAEMGNEKGGARRGTAFLSVHRSEGVTCRAACGAWSGPALRSGRCRPGAGRGGGRLPGRLPPRRRGPGGSGPCRAFRR